MIGKGDGTFALSTQYGDLSGGGLALLDLNGDGNLDLLNLDGSEGWGFKVAFGNGDGTFGTPTFYPISDEDSRFLAMGDFSGDGIPDVVTVADQGVWLMTGQGNGVFNQPVLAVAGTANATYRFAAADMNDDGKLDLVVSIGIGVAILFGNGDETFQPPDSYGTPFPGPSVTVADVNSDGYPDVICSTTSATNKGTIFLGEAGGTLGRPYNVAIENYEAR